MIPQVRGFDLPETGRSGANELFLFFQFRAGCNPSGGRHMEITELDPIRSEHGPVGVAFGVGHQNRAATRIDGDDLLARAWGGERAGEAAAVLSVDREREPNGSHFRLVRLSGRMVVVS